ncbi:DUF4126 family protein [Novosphingobium kaempferiae]|uniref:DUF4126 family protein n=1 Tax=Novosphingobium kaempferiae TaxID=2896849 RepID=UPI001E5C8572|nr:DUF4126 family protein [Novosphingobium kaempferiae]
MIVLLSFLIGIVAGLRAMMAPVLVSWAAYGGLIELKSGWLAWLGYRFTPWILTIAALAELVSDKLPNTPSRKVPQQFGTRIFTGALSGAAVGAAGGAWVLGLVAGAIGAVVGTFGGAAARGALARVFGRDMPAALVEDLVALVLGVAVVLHA